MHTPTIVRRLAGVSAAALAAATLSAAPAQAAPVFTEADIDASSYLEDNSSCTENPPVITPDIHDAPITENGAPVTVSTSANGSVTDGAMDTQTGASNVKLTGAVSSTGTTLKSIDVNVQASLSVTNTRPSSTCHIHLGSSADLDFTFTVTQPGFLTVNQKSRGSLYSDIWLFGHDATQHYSNYAKGIDVDTSDVLYLPVGTYSGFVQAKVGISTSSAMSESGSSTVKATFEVAGSQSAVTTGKGKKYVDMPAAGRSCAADTVTATVTSKKSRAKLIKSITFIVNDKFAKKVKRPKKGASVVLTGIADADAADVRAVVTLVNKANGTPRRAVEAAASFVACSPSA